MTKGKTVLGLFSLAMINVAIICSIRGLPMMAEYGPSIIFFLLIAVVLFLIPVSLVSAELATSWPKRGGIYAWVKQAFGEKWGFVTICLQWLQNLVFYPTALAATAAVIAYLINPALAENKLFTLAVIIVVYWGAIWINSKGMKISGLISTFGTILGIILPGAFIIILAIVWILAGEPSQISLTWHNTIPDLSSIKNIVFLTGLFLFFAGMEVSGVHAKEVHDPQKDYPKAIFISAAIVVGIFLLGSLAIAVILPASEISLTAGIMQTFKTVLDKFNLSWMIPIIVLLAAPGMIVQVSSWIAGPSRGLLATARNGDLPPFLQYMNKHNMPIHIMVVQGIVVSLIAFTFLFMPSVSSSFWILTALAALIYLTVYIVMFLAAIKLRYSEPHTHRPYKVPGGIFGMWFFAGLGIFACLSAIFLGFFPPSQLPTGNLFFYEAFLSIGLLGMIAIPFIIYALRKPSWKKNINTE
ncbi:MAG: transporter [Candidatus Woykebacteria bacterium RBG_13_40_7b]|uniref:Transporter n=1 Tax=Candidatus Woykebacteria bacterium RBG_13_40_7b TaxID=1802594 RepID=A0A1G1WAK3_9BACT|nr:MAG: transporter [Candidatus Woykebacteria bacterium RBG_13_40_7b]